MICCLPKTPLLFPPFPFLFPFPFSIQNNSNHLYWLYSGLALEINRHSLLRDESYIFYLAWFLIMCVYIYIVF